MLALVLCLASAAASAPPPVPLSAADLVGTWVYARGDFAEGRIRFYPDGTFRSHLTPELQYVGRWEVEGRTLLLDEYWLWPATGEVTGPFPRRIEITRRDPAALGGRVADCCGGPGAVLTLSGRTR